MAKRVPIWQYRVVSYINWFISRKLSWRNQQRLSKFKKWLRDKGHITFDGITPCYIKGRHEYREIDDDRYYDMIDLGVINLFTGERYLITEFE